MNSTNAMYRTIPILSALLTSAALTITAQADILLHRADPFSVKAIDGESIPYPFIGGWFNIKPHFADIDNDGDEDLFVVGQFPDDRVSFYRNTGTPEAARFEIAEERMRGVRVRSFLEIVDIDADGDFDFLSDLDTVLVVHENVGTPEAHSFVTTTPSYIDSLPDARSAGLSSYPRMKDLDGDGDPDFLYMKAIGGTPIFHENKGTPTEPQFVRGVEGWGGFSTNEFGGRVSAEDNRHGFASLTIADISNDSMPDIIIGDLVNPNLWFFHNVSSDTVAQFNQITQSLIPESFDNRLSSDVADLDSDQRLELYVSSAGTSELAEDGVFRVYEQDAAGSFAFDLRDSVFLPCIDIGTHSRPHLTDFDNDGDLDLIVSGGKTETFGQDVSLLRFIENVGSATSPEFVRVESGTTPFSVITPKLFNEGYMTFAFGDLDGDDDLDMFLGTYWSLLQYENVGTREAPQYVLVGEPDLPSLNTDNAPTPALGDLDNDGDLDMIVGEQGNSFTPNLFLYRNDGDAENFMPVFLSDNRIGGEFFPHGLDGGPVTGSTQNRHFVPTLADVNDDSLLDIVLGYGFGRVVTGLNMGGGSFRFERAENHTSLEVGLDAAPSLGDVDGDGDLDLVIGELDGGVNYFETIATRFAAERTSDDTTEVRWFAGFDADLSFSVYRSSGGSSPFTEIASGLGASASGENVYYDTGLDPAIAYAYKLGATVGDTTIVDPDSVSTDLAAFEFLGLEVSAAEAAAQIRWSLLNQRPDVSFRLVRSRPAPAEYVVTSSEDGFLYELLDETAVPGNVHEYELFVTIDTVETRLAADTLFLTLPILTIAEPAITWQSGGYLVSWTATPVYPGLTFDLIRIQGSDSTVVNGAPIEPVDGAAAATDAGVDPGRGVSYLAKAYYMDGETRTAVQSDLTTGTAVTTAGSRSFSFARIVPHPVQRQGQEVRIGFQLPSASEVEVEIFSITGRRIRTLRGSFAAGPARELFWDLRNENDETVSSGRYFLKARVDGVEIDRTQSVTVVR
ncbi:MAG: hypothetical protein HKN20_01650 [Gemmatimonadetes bacterium]|nr:hypothetical protein [Gemmatimonadota bacterium]